MVLIGGMDRLGPHYRNEAIRFGHKLSIFTRACPKMRTKIRHADALALFTKKFPTMPGTRRWLWRKTGRQFPLKRLIHYLSSRSPLLRGTNFVLNCLLCFCLSLVLGAGALAAAFILLAAFFGDRFCDLLGPKVAVRNRMNQQLISEKPPETPLQPNSKQDA